jgi:curli biogenesis system outer membrane secretion channel CsgG
MKLISTILLMSSLATGCGSFKAKRVDANESDEKGLEITDNWMSADTAQAVQEVLKQIKAHKGFQRYLAQNGGEPPKLFIAEVQNQTSEAYFPIGDLNDELLNELSSSGDFVLVDNAAREKILGEITYQNDGMVDPKTAKSVGKQTGADIMIFGNVYMKPEKRNGKTIKEYSVNLRMTNVEQAVEVMRARTKVFKYSEKSSLGL